MNWDVTVNPAALGVIGVAWQWARGSAIAQWVSTVAAIVVTIIAYVATTRPEAPADIYGWFELPFHFAVWIIAARGFATVSQHVKVGTVALAPPTREVEDEA